MAYCSENVCVELDNENTHLYAIGSRSHISFVDDRLSDKVTSVRSLDKDCGKYFHTIQYTAENFLIRYSSLPKSSVTDVFSELNQNRSSIGAVSDQYTHICIRPSNNMS